MAYESAEIIENRPLQIFMPLEQLEQPEREQRLQLLETSITAADRLDEEYANTWHNIAAEKGLPSDEFKLDPKEVIQIRGPIPVDKFMNHALYGAHGYYTLGRAKINEATSLRTILEKQYDPRPEDKTAINFRTVVAQEQNVYSFFRLLEEIRKKEGANTDIDLISLASGRGDFEKKYMGLVADEILGPIRKLITLDYSEPHIKQNRAFGQENIKEDSSLIRIQGSVLDIPIQTEGVDAVFSNELHDALAPYVYFKDDSGDFFKPMVGYDKHEDKFYLKHHRISSLDHSLIDLQKQFFTDIHHPHSQARSTYMLSMINNVRLMKEIARILKPNGICLHADYARLENGQYMNDLRFQIGSNFNHFLLANIHDYTAPYLDITQEMDPNFLNWVGQAFSLMPAYDQTQAELIGSFAKEIDNKEVLKERIPQDYFRILAQIKVE